MLRTKRLILSLALLVMALCTATAQQPVQVSLLTCTPGEDLYTKFGHTAIRVNNGYGSDWVFNYGCFDYNSDNFVMKFLLGQTDYKLQAEPMSLFMERYREMGMGVTEQILDLNESEANRLVELLDENIKPENQTYRYNWLYDNCTERARDMIEKALDGGVDYHRDNDQTLTVRFILIDCLKDSPWTNWGISLLLGSDIDMPQDRKVQMFLPELFRQELNEARVFRTKGGVNPIVKQEIELLKPAKETEPAGPITPNIATSILLAFTIALTIYDFRRKRMSIWYDLTLSIIQGLVGCLITFLFLFSEHPSVDSNWLVIIFNPAILIYSFTIYYNHKKRKRNIFAAGYTIIMIAFIPTMFLCVQAFYLSTLLLVCSFSIRALTPTFLNK